MLFSNINEELPPFTTQETVSFYQDLDFDYGVSIDHLILPAHLYRIDTFHVDDSGKQRNVDQIAFDELSESGIEILKSERKTHDCFHNQPYLYSKKIDDKSEAKRRWKITLDNSNDFIEVHKKSKATFMPIAGCQGWDVESQTEMFKEQQAMGFKYIALGGLVRSKTSQILELLESVNRIRKPDTKIHLFGVARPDAIQAFVDAGVNSIDSARFLRQAWLSATSNYYTGDGTSYADVTRSGQIDPSIDIWRYSAIRVPPVQREGGESLLSKAKKLVESGQQIDHLLKKEKVVLDAIHKFDRGEIDLDDVLEQICAYDQLMGGDPRNETRYRKVLTDQPWKKCPCIVCQQTGIDTVVFRRNNRNRRRGFHNTWWFFEYFRKITSTQDESLPDKSDATTLDDANLFSTI